MCAVSECILPPALQQLAQPSECLVTRIVKDLVAGGDIGFTERGKRDLKGLTEGVDLFAVTPDSP